MNGLAAYQCDAEKIDVEKITVFYSKRTDRLLSIVVTLPWNPADPSAGRIGGLLETVVDIPYAGADAAAAGEWLRTCLALDDYDYLVISRTISGVTFTISDTRDGFFTLTVSKISTED